MASKIICQIYFLDVGQGSGQVIYLGRGRAILIDGGESWAADVPLRLMHDLRIRSIEAIVVTHNDSDHHDGAAEVFAAHRHKVKRVIYLRDRENCSDLKLVRLVQQENRGREAKSLITIEQIRLERERKKRVIFESRSLGVRLAVLYPDMPQNNAASNPNVTSGILRFSCGRSSIIFPGDASLPAWKWLHKHEGRIRCNVLAVPHHGGRIWTSNSPSHIQKQLKWLYNEAVNCRFAVVSAGTSNGNNHPRRESIHAINASKASPAPTVLCTQITARCCKSPSDFASGIIEPHGASLSRMKPESLGVACAGTIVAEVSDDDVSIALLKRHQARLDELSASKQLHPLCRP